jgi:hypothetical protein
VVQDKKRQEQEANELAEKKRIKEQMDALKKQEKKKKGGEQSTDPVAAAVEVGKATTYCIAPFCGTSVLLI